MVESKLEKYLNEDYDKSDVDSIIKDAHNEIKKYDVSSYLDDTFELVDEFSNFVNHVKKFMNKHKRMYKNLKSLNLSIEKKMENLDRKDGYISVYDDDDLNELNSYFIPSILSLYDDVEDYLENIKDINLIEGFGDSQDVIYKYLRKIK